MAAKEQYHNLNLFKHISYLHDIRKSSCEFSKGDIVGRDSTMPANAFSTLQDVPD